MQAPFSQFSAGRPTQPDFQNHAFPISLSMPIPLFRKMKNFLSVSGHSGMAVSLSFDLGHVTVLDPVHISPDDATPDSLCARTTASFRQLFRRLETLERADDGHSALPPPMIEMPRSKPIPMDAPTTRWEQFVKNKQLTMRKKETKIFDEESGEWRLRYGYKRAGKKPEDWLIEVPNGVGEDPFEKRESAKKESIADQQKRERRNQKRADRARAAVAAVSTKGSFRTEALKAAVARASNPGSSASMNQFNKLPNKPAIFERGSRVPKIFDRTKGRRKRGKK
jgi:regulator of ribosome biosynthesis